MAWRRWFRAPGGVDRWSTSLCLVCLLILLPLAGLLFGLGDRGEYWGHLMATVLPGYLSNTLWLVVSVCALSLLMAVPPAWLLSHFEVPGRRVLVWAMVLPLAIPTYVAAFVYMQVPEAAIPWLVDLRRAWGVEVYLFAEAFLRKGMLALLLASVLYPYLYLSLRTAFAVQRKGVIEAAHLLGRGPRSVFFSVALPLARPALVAGLSLIVMEVLNDYGAVHFFGVPTLTEGIFRTWFGLGDRASAVRIAGLMMLGVLALLLLEQGLRGRARFVETSRDSAPLLRRSLRPAQAVGALLACLWPLALGFVLPVAQLLRWAWISRASFGDAGIWSRVGHSLLLALGTSGGLTLLALLLAYALRLHPRRGLRQLLRVASLGYAIPGAVVAVGVMRVLGWVDAGGHGPFLIGTVFAIGFAYAVRFLAVALHPVQAALQRVCGSLDAASRLLGHSPGDTLWRINLPLVRGSLVAVTMLVFVDILKELPLTMILRPVSFDTLATLSFGLAKEGRIHECAIPSLLIVVLAGLGLFGMHRMLQPSDPPTSP